MPPIAIDTTVFPDVGGSTVDAAAIIPVPWSIGVLTYENNGLTVAVRLF